MKEHCFDVASGQVQDDGLDVASRSVPGHIWVPFGGHYQANCLFIHEQFYHQVKESASEPTHI